MYRPDFKPDMITWPLAGSFSLKSTANPLTRASDKQFRVWSKSKANSIPRHSACACSAVNKNKCHKVQLRRQMHQCANIPAAGSNQEQGSFQLSALWAGKQTRQTTSCQWRQKELSLDIWYLVSWHKSPVLLRIWTHPGQVNLVCKD